MVDFETPKRCYRVAHLSANALGHVLIEIFHYLALFVIGSSIVWSAGINYQQMWGQGHLSIADVLLLFIYLELGEMVAIYFRTNLMPVRCLIYIAITALARLLIGDIQVNHHVDEHVLLISGSILLLALATRIIRNPAAH